MTTDLRPAVAQIVVTVAQAPGYHNPGGAPNTIWVEKLGEHNEEVRICFASAFLDESAVRISTSWLSSGGIYFITTLQYVIKDADHIDFDGLIEEAVSNLPEGMSLLRVEHYNTLDGGVWVQCSECRGTGHKTIFSSYAGDREVDCSICGGYGKVQTEEPHKYEAQPITVA